MTLPPEVTAALTAAGWHPDSRDETRGKRLALALAAYAGPDGTTHTVVPPAVEAWARFGGLSVPAGDTGTQVAPSAFTLDPLPVRATGRIMSLLAAALRAEVTPIGTEGQTGILVTDTHGRVHVCDHTGDWFLGETLDDAITALVLGLAPRRILQDGTW